MKLVTTLCSFALISFTFACSTTKVTKLPGGGFRISCEGGLNECATRAEKICGDRGFTVTYGRSKTSILGGPSSSYKQAATSGFLEGVCGEAKKDLDDAGRERVVFQLGGSETPPPAPSSAQPAPSAPPSTPAPVHACVPGASQKCFGAGACEGGQACLADGSGFGPCQCAAPASSVPSSASVPASSLK